MSRRSAWFFALFTLITGSIGKTNTIIDFSGHLRFDSDVQFFVYPSPNAGLLTVNASSFADGGFAPILGLHNSTGELLFTADGAVMNDCTIANRADMRGTGFCYDTQLSWDSVAGQNYHVGLSEYDNFPIANIALTQPVATSNNIDTFSEFGSGFFTAGSPFGPGCGQAKSFCLQDGNPRGNRWFTFNGPDGLVAHAPETSSIFLVLGGLAMLCGRLLRIRKRAARV